MYTGLMEVWDFARSSHTWQPPEPGAGSGISVWQVLAMSSGWERSLCGHSRLNIYECGSLVYVFLEI